MFSECQASLDCKALAPTVVSLTLLSLLGPLFLGFLVNTAPLVHYFNVSISGPGKENLRSSLHALSFEQLDHRHDFSFIQSPLVSFQRLRLPAKQHWLDFPRASHTQNVQN